MRSKESSSGVFFCLSYVVFFLFTKSYLFILFLIYAKYQCENKNILFGILTLLMMVILGGSLLRWIIFPTPSLICLPIYLKIIVIFVTLFGGLVGYEISKMRLGKIVLSEHRMKSRPISFFFFFTSNLAHWVN